MKNRTHFVPAAFQPQPDEYRFIGEAWAAVWYRPDGEYHLQLNLDWGKIFGLGLLDAVKSVSALKQTPSCRVTVEPREHYPTIRGGLEALTRAFAKGGIQ